VYNDCKGEIIEKGLYERDKIQIGLKWPLANAKILCGNLKLNNEFQEIIKSQLNVKELSFKENKNPKKVFSEILKQCKTLDELKINKEEMHKPLKNIIIKNNKPILIDFERCHYTLRPKNLNQFKQFPRVQCSINVSRISIPTTI